MALEFEINFIIPVVFKSFGRETFFFLIQNIVPICFF